MKFSSLARAPRRIALTVAVLSFAALPCLPLAAQSDEDAPRSPTPTAPQPAKPPAPDKTAEAHPLPPLPPDAHVEQSITLDGKKLTYTVTVGTLFVRDADGKAAGEVVYTAYTVDGPNRPVTFALNGGPGAASVYLNFGAIGPKHLELGNEGDSPSDPPVLNDNPGTWLDFTDLVFIDPIGTGFSRSLVAADQTRKLFYSTEPDIEYLSRIIYDWLVKNDRLESRKYLVGESYGGFRGPRITYYLQSQLGVAMNGVVLVSPYLNPTLDRTVTSRPCPGCSRCRPSPPPISSASTSSRPKPWPRSSPTPAANTPPTCSRAAPTPKPRPTHDPEGHRHDRPRTGHSCRRPAAGWKPALTCAKFFASRASSAPSTTPT